METPTFTAAYDTFRQALRPLQSLAHVISPSQALDTPDRADLAVLLAHPALRAHPFDDEGTQWADIVAALLVYKEMSIENREWLCDVLRLLLTEVRTAVDAMAACVRTPEGPDADQDA